MFPELFGGGQAKLIMTGEEILDAGVQVMAQPPAKKTRPSTCSQAAKKALTAIALVFCHFPAQPCAVLPARRSGRAAGRRQYRAVCKLVSRMSTDTQFLFISHNKITMEMAEQLIGVTMQKQGVSRVVAVDMDAAMHMAQV